VKVASLYSTGCIVFSVAVKNVFDGRVRETKIERVIGGVGRAVKVERMMVRLKMPKYWTGWLQVRAGVN
jgi:hypothetical protein